MSRRPKPSLEPVSVVDLCEAVLAMIDERFEGRLLTIDTATMALAPASFDLKMAHLRAVADSGS